MLLAIIAAGLVNVYIPISSNVPKKTPGPVSAKHAQAIIAAVMDALRFRFSHIAVRLGFSKWVIRMEVDMMRNVMGRVNSAYTVRALHNIFIELG